MQANELDSVLRYIRIHIYNGKNSDYERDRRMLLYALTWPAAWLDSQALRMNPEDYQRMLMDKLGQIHVHGDPARYRAYFPKYLLKCLQDHCHHHHETLYRELKHASYSIEEILDHLQNSQPEHTTVLAKAHALLRQSHRKKDTTARARQMTLGL
jgi:predicted metal-dependent enzyme (double-stranded beta helix superfamily)